MPQANNNTTTARCLVGRSRVRTIFMGRRTTTKAIKVLITQEMKRFNDWLRHCCGLVVSFQRSSMGLLRFSSATGRSGIPHLPGTSMATYLQAKMVMNRNVTMFMTIMLSVIITAHFVLPGLTAAIRHINKSMEIFIKLVAASKRICSETLRNRGSSVQAGPLWGEGTRPGITHDAFKSTVPNSKGRASHMCRSQPSAKWQ